MSRVIIETITGNAYSFDGDKDILVNNEPHLASVLPGMFRAGTIDTMTWICEGRISVENMSLPEWEDEETHEVTGPRTLSGVWIVSVWEAR